MSTHLWDVIRGNRDSIWVDWIFQIHLRDQTVWVARENTGSWSWRKLLTLRAALILHIHFRIGDGVTFLLWNDPWHSLGPLITRFPRGPQLTRTCLSDTLDRVIEDGQWRWPLITDIEHLDILTLLPDIHGGDDSIAWIPDGGNFSSSSAYIVFLPPGSKVGWSSLLVGSFRVPRHCFILWLAILESEVPVAVPRLGAWYLMGCDDLEEYTCGVLAYRALLASIVYHIWQERNRRRFQGIQRPSYLVGSIAVEEVKLRITSVNLGPSVSTRVFIAYGGSLGQSRGMPVDDACATSRCPCNMDWGLSCLATATDWTADEGPACEGLGVSILETLGGAHWKLGWRRRKRLLQCCPQSGRW
ncbi:UNVERIFIED_CONTAM: hypothetical protein Slati_2467000 [Sesamum latifolium]|uniref:Reverse transcriptase zinc-binding domain-containing protein n=1 Tax=Sesamum latifolium TaxID=2727402 RepID=A0AAW2WDI3_9LAMI